MICPGVAVLLKPCRYQRQTAGIRTAGEPENMAGKQKAMPKYGPNGSGGLVHGLAYEAADVEDHVYGDGFNTQLAIATLEDHIRKNTGKPLFLALGLVQKPS